MSALVSMSAPAAAPPTPSALLASLFPAGVVSVVLRRPAALEELDRREASLCAGFSAKRRADFAGGRVCARHALARLGQAPAPLLIDEDRRPAWPAAVLGSITHTADFCAAAVARRSEFAAIGLDAERYESVTPDLWPQILRPNEIERIRALPRGTSLLHAAIIFSAKEAFYKCQFERTRAWLGFEDVSIDVTFETADGGSVCVRPVDPQRLPHDVLGARGRFRIETNLVVTGFAVLAGEDADDAP